MVLLLVVSIICVFRIDIIGLTVIIIVGSLIGAVGDDL